MSRVFFLSGDFSPDGEYCFFRKTFYLDAVPESAVFRMQSYGHCAFFLNNTFVECSLGRHPGRIAAFDVTRFLHQGKNVISLQLGGDFFQPAEERIREMTGNNGSLIAFTLTLDTEILVSDSNVLQTGVAFPEWSSPDFDDSDWQPAKQIIPVSEEELHSAWRNTAIWPPWQPTVLNPVAEENHHLFDFGKTVVGYPVLEFPKEYSGQVIFLQFDFSESPSDFGEDASPSVKRRIEKLAVHAQIEPDGFVHIYRRRAFRYLKLSAGNAKPVAVRLLQSCYPADIRGKFSCSDPLLNRIDEVAEYTLRVNMHQEFESCPRHEMLGFSGDVRLDSLIAAYLYGDTTLTRSFFYQKHCHDLIHVPGRVYSRTEERSLWDYPAWYLIMIQEYVLFSGDLETARDLWPVVLMNAQWYADKLDNHFLLYQIVLQDRHHDNPAIVEYSCATSRIGYKVFLNALVARSFDAAATLAGWLGKQHEQSEYLELASRMKHAISEKLWDPAAGCFRDFSQKFLPQDGNALAVLFGAATADQTQSALETLKRKTWSQHGSAMADIPMPLDGNFGGRDVISPLMNCYEAEAHFLKGQPDDALELIRRTWGSMLKKGAHTFWEYNWNDPDKRWFATAHAWSAGPAYLLRACVAGIIPLSPGFSQIRVRPRPGSLAFFSCIIPTPYGNISLDYQDDTFTLKHPASIQCVEIDLPPGKKILVNP